MDTGIHVLIQEIVIHVTTHNINVYILITKYQSRYFNYIKMFYYIHVTICILIHSEYFFVWLTCDCITIGTYSTYSTYLLLLSTHSSLIIGVSPLLLSYGGSPPASPASQLAGLLRRRDPSTNPGPKAWWVSVGN